MRSTQKRRRAEPGLDLRSLQVVLKLSLADVVRVSVRQSGHTTSDACRPMPMRGARHGICARTGHICFQDGNITDNLPSGAYVMLVTMMSGPLRIVSITSQCIEIISPIMAHKHLCISGGQKLVPPFESSWRKANI